MTTDRRAPISIPMQPMTNPEQAFLGVFFSPIKHKRLLLPRIIKISSLHGLNVAADAERTAFRRLGVTHLEAVDGVGRWQPGGARVLLGTEGSVEGPGDGAQVEGAHG